MNKCPALLSRPPPAADMRHGKDEKMGMEMDVCQARPVRFNSTSICCPSAIPLLYRVHDTDVGAAKNIGVGLSTDAGLI